MGRKLTDFERVNGLPTEYSGVSAEVLEYIIFHETVLGFLHMRAETAGSCY